MIKNFISIILLILFSALILGLSIRGVTGNPTEATMNTPYWRDAGPFELSPERGRFALTYSLFENKSFYFSESLARFTVPDLGTKNGHYVSLFAPGVSFLVAPGYLIGKSISLAQVGTVAIISFFAIVNAVLIRIISKHLGASKIAATIAGLVFLFATPAFAYGVTLYQHHVSTFLILLSILILVRSKKVIWLGLIWILFGFSLTVDYPNLFLMAPIAIVAGLRAINILELKDKIQIGIRAFPLIAPILVILPLLFFFWFNSNTYGDPFQLSGVVDPVTHIEGNADIFEQVKHPETEREAIKFFNTRDMLNGLSIHLLSPDRGVMYYTPVILFAVLGLSLLFKKNKFTAQLLLSIIGVNIVVYSMWGDPWGGWAFGSRYLIPAYACAAILLSFALTHFRKNVIVLLIMLLACIYSVSVNTLGALTSSANPPQIQVLQLEELSGVEQKYTWGRNLDYLLANHSKSFIYQTYLKDNFTAPQYFLLIAGMINVVFISLFISLKIYENKSK